jgi:hypothetical protein
MISSPVLLVGREFPYHSITKYTIVNKVFQISGAELNRLGLKLEIERGDCKHEVANFNIAILKLQKKLKDRDEHKD